MKYRNRPVVPLELDATLAETLLGGTRGFMLGMLAALTVVIPFKAKRPNRVAPSKQQRLLTP